MQRLASCWQAPARRYHHDALAASVGADETDAAMRLLHDLLWSDWVKGAAEAQEIDLFLHLSAAGSQDPAAVASAWLRAEPFGAFIPEWVTNEDRCAFTAKLRLALERLRNRLPDRFRSTEANPQDIPRSARVYRIRDLIEHEYGNPGLSLRSLSKRVRLSERHVSRLFKSLTGKNVGRYVRDVRIAKAAALLANADYDIKFIAWAIGYKDRSHFSRDFRKCMGCTPGQFRGRGQLGNRPYFIKMSD